MSEKKFIIYQHINKINNKIYIGQTCQNLNGRCGINGQNYRTNELFWEDIKKYGWNDGFEHKILYENLSLEEADAIEIELIKQYDSTNPEKGYNKDKGGHNALHSEHTKELMRQNQLGERNSFYGHKHTEETKKKIGEAQQGYKHHNAKKVQASTGEIFNTLTEAALWCNVSSNFRGKISEVRQGKRQHAGVHPETKEKLKWKYI